MNREATTIPICYGVAKIRPNIIWIGYFSRIIAGKKTGVLSAPYDPAIRARNETPSLDARIKSAHDRGGVQEPE